VPKTTQIVRARFLQKHAEEEPNALVGHGGDRAHDEHPVNQLVTAPVVGHPVQVIDGERLARLGPSLGYGHSIHGASRGSTLSSFRRALTIP
jgi:hypothetical protein